MTRTFRTSSALILAIPAGLAVYCLIRVASFEVHWIARHLLGH